MSELSPYCASKQTSTTATSRHVRSGHAQSRASDIERERGCREPVQAKPIGWPRAANLHRKFSFLGLFIYRGGAGPFHPQLTQMVSFGFSLFGLNTLGPQNQ